MLSHRSLFLLSRFAASNAAELPLILPTHPGLIPRPLAALPEPSTLPPNNAPAAKRARLDGVVLLAATISTDHPVGPLLRVFLGGVVALVARVNFATTRESKPPVRTSIVRTRAFLGERLPYVQPELLLPPAGAGRRR